MITIPGELGDLNTYIKKLNSHYHAGNKMKQEQTELVRWSAHKEPRVKKYPVKIIFSWYSKDQRKDIDNVSAFGRKVCLDGLVRAGVLEDDSRKFVSALEDRFYIDKHNPRVEIEIKSN